MDNEKLDEIKSELDKITTNTSNTLLCQIELQSINKTLVAIEGGIKEQNRLLRVLVSNSIKTDD